ncbi:MAG: LptE family protein [Planctomycetota bacterium]|nr:LptE family protein [Planctomycetota bacterium]
MKARVAAGVLIAVALLWALAACAADPREGYSTESVYSTAVRTVAVPIFENETFSRGLEFELTDAVIKEIEARTPYKVTTQPRADTILTGRITRVELDQLSKSRLTGLGEEVVLSVTIDFEWKDWRTDAPLVARRSFSGHGLAVPSAPTGERLELGRMAAVQQLARDLVEEMRAAW